MSRPTPHMDSPALAPSVDLDEPDGGPMQHSLGLWQRTASIPGVPGSSNSQSGPTPRFQTMESLLKSTTEGPSQPRRSYTEIHRSTVKQARQTRSRPLSLIEGSGGKQLSVSQGGNGYQSENSDCDISDPSIRSLIIDGPSVALPRFPKSRDSNYSQTTDTSGYSSAEQSKKSSRRSHPREPHHQGEEEVVRQAAVNLSASYQEGDYTGDESGRLFTSALLSSDGLTDDPADAYVRKKYPARGTVPAEQLSASALVGVARMIPSLKECKSLAAALGFSATEIKKINSFDEMTAYFILNEWAAKRGRQATGVELLNALERMDLQFMTDDCRHLLVQTRKEDVQHVQGKQGQSPRIRKRLQENITDHPQIAPSTSSSTRHIPPEHKRAGAATVDHQSVNPNHDDRLQARLANIPGGYDALFHPPLEPKHTCSVCNKALRDPMQTECGHRFCKVCVEPLLKKGQTASSAPVTCPISTCQEPLTEVYPDNFCRREVLSLHVKCSNSEGGCHWTGQLIDLEAHLKTCQHGLLPCPHRERGCKEMLQQPDIEKHARERCRFRNYVCPYCRETFVFFAFEKHIDEDCQEYAQLCPAGCGQTVKRSDLQDHLWKYCSMVDRCCPLANLGCQVKGKHPELVQHMHNQDALFDHMGLVGEHLLNSSNQLKPVMQTVENQGVHLAGVEKSLEAEREAHKQTRARLMVTEERLKDFENKLAAFQALLDERPAHQATASRPDDQLAAFESRLAATERKAVQAEATAKTAKENVETNRLKVAGIERQVSSFNQIITRTDAIMAEFDLRLLSQETSSFNGTLIWKIPDFSRHFEEARSGHKPSLYSPPFYTSRHGYKVCARVYLNGDGSGKNTHMSIFFVVMRGEFDALLHWPFRQKVTLTLLDQMQGRSNISDTFQPDPRSSSFQRPISEMNIASGCPKFVPHETLRSSNHLRNNTIFIRVAVDTTGLPNY